VIKRFADFLRIDRKLQPRTVQDHVYNLRGFLRFVKKPIDRITVDDVREYLKRYVDGNVCTYGNKIKTLRRFLGDFLGYSWIRGFKIPKPNFKPKILPSKEELKRFYEALPSLRYKAMFLLLASSGLRLGEVLSLTRSEIDLERRLIAPKQHGGETKRCWVSCFNEEAAEALSKYLSEHGGERIFPTNKGRVAESFRKASKAAGVKITPQTLRAWFACEMAKLGVSDRFIDAFCGRTPKTVLARYYTDYSPQRLKEIYDRAGLKVLS
jgi:integrase/recombinase XerD